MNKQEAAQLIDQAISQLRATREDHIKLQQAISVLTRSDDTKEESTE